MGGREIMVETYVTSLLLYSDGVGPVQYDTISMHFLTIGRGVPPPLH